MMCTHEYFPFQSVLPGEHWDAANEEYGYDSTQPDLGVQLFTGTGLIDVYRYYPASPTTPASVFRDGDTLPEDADDPGGGGVPGYLQAAGVRHGSAGTILWQTSVDYIGYTVHYGTANATTAYYVFNSSVYAAEDHTGDTAPVPLPGSDAAMTAYRYTFQADATGVGPTIAGQTTILPTVTAAQNGPDASADTADWYNAEGQLKWQRDERGYLTYYAYDSLGNLVATIENVNSGDGLTLPGGWSLPAVANGPSVHRQYDYDSTGRVTRTRGPAFTDDQGRSVCTVTWTQYDDAHQEAFSALGYFNNGDSTYTLVNPLSVTKYNANGQMTDEIGLAWDGLGTSPLNISGLLSIPATWAEDSHYVRKAWTSYQYSHTHLASTRVYYDLAGGHYDETTYGYENDGQGWMGRRNKAVSPGGTITRVVYDARGNVLETWVGTDDSDATDGDPGYRGPSQSNSNNLVRVSSATYDADGNMLSSTQYVDANTNHDRVTQYAYDWRGRQVFVVNPPDDQGDTTYAMTTFDNLGRATMSRQFRYLGGDLEDDLAEVPGQAAPEALDSSDALLAQSSTEYDSLGRVYRTSTYLVDRSVSPSVVTSQQDTDYWRDAAGNVIKLRDPVSNETTWVYDGLNRMTQSSDELAHPDYYYYNDAGGLTSKIDRRGWTTTFEYDGIGRQTAEKWWDGATVIETISFAYNNAGLLETLSDSGSTYTYQYDAAGNVTEETQTLAGLTPMVIFNSQYTDGHRTQLAAAMNDGSKTYYDFVNDYQYASDPSTNPFEQMSRVTQQSHGAVSLPDVADAVAEKYASFAYNRAGQSTSIGRYANTAGTQEVATAGYGYDLLGRLTSLTYTKTGSTLPAYEWAYDLLGNMEESSAELGAVTTYASYASDSTGQLGAATYSGTSAPDDEDYSYDANGNRTMADHVTGDGNRLLSDGTFDYVYDDNGNVTSRVRISEDPAEDKTTLYEWDHRNRLTKVTLLDEEDGITKTITYTYDPMNRWLGEVITAGAETVVENRRFVYDGYQIAMQFDKTASGDLAATDLSHRYLYGPAVDQVLADEQVSDLETAGTNVWTLGDHQNTVRDLATYNEGTDTTTVVNHRVFSAYGELLSQTNTSVDPQTVATVDCLFAFTGRALSRFSENTSTGGVAGIQNNLNRWYDGITGRWLSRDPIGYDANDSNLYRYCFNQPLTGTDPTGKILPVVVGVAIGVYFFWPDTANAPAPHDPTYPSNPHEGIPYAAVAGATAGMGPSVLRATPGVVRAAARTAGRVGAQTYVVGTLTAAQIQQLIASSGARVVTVFTRVTSSPATNRVLHAATDSKLCDTLQRGTLYAGRIPADLYTRLKLEGAITHATTEMHGVRGTEVIINAETMQILYQYFEQVPK